MSRDGVPSQSSTSPNWPPNVRHSQRGTIGVIVRSAGSGSTHDGVARFVGADAGGVELVDLVIAQTGDCGEDLAGVLTEERRVAAQGGIALDEPPRDVRLLVA